MEEINQNILKTNGDFLKTVTKAEFIDSEVTAFFSNFDLHKTLHLVIASIIFFLLYKLTVFVFKKIYNYMSHIKTQNLIEIKFKKIVLISNENINQGLSISFKVFKSIFFLIFIYSFLTYALNIFECTKNISSKLVSYFFDIISLFTKSFFSFAPNLLIIASIIAITYFILEFAKLIVRRLYLQQIAFRGFRKEWIRPTYQILRFIIIAFALVMIFPYLPGSNSPAFQGISVFIGVLLSLGSSSAVANMIAGIVLIYMSPFGPGDKVKMGDIIGVIEEMGLLATRLKTIYNEDITIPNSIILSKEVINYTTSAKDDERLIIRIPLGLGYDIDVETVDKLLLSSCDNAQGVLSEPKSFVLVKELSDYCIQYELNAYIDDAKNLLISKSELQRNILKNFKDAGAEILSPAHIAVRDKV